MLKGLEKAVNGNIRESEGISEHCKNLTERSAKAGAKEATTLLKNLEEYWKPVQNRIMQLYIEKLKPLYLLSLISFILYILIIPQTEYFLGNMSR